VQKVEAVFSLIKEGNKCIAVAMEIFSGDGQGKKSDAWLR